MQYIKFRFLGPEDPLEKEMATHSSILAWKVPWTEELGGLQSMGSQESAKGYLTPDKCGCSSLIWHQNTKDS